jgi:hypothetical protein
MRAAPEHWVQRIIFEWIDPLWGVDPNHLNKNEVMLCTTEYLARFEE